eukprot:6192697-Pleurochrysis_carterae.AAC.2
MAMVAGVLAKLDAVCLMFIAYSTCSIMEGSDCCSKAKCQQNSSSKTTSNINSSIIRISVMKDQMRAPTPHISWTKKAFYDHLD